MSLLLCQLSLTGCVNNGFSRTKQNSWTTTKKNRCIHIPNTRFISSVYHVYSNRILPIDSLESSKLFILKGLSQHPCWVAWGPHDDTFSCWSKCRAAIICVVINTIRQQGAGCLHPIEIILKTYCDPDSPNDLANHAAALPSWESSDKADRDN